MFRVLSVVVLGLALLLSACGSAVTNNLEGENALVITVIDGAKLCACVMLA
jgi:hypothetical protein